MAHRLDDKRIAALVAHGFEQDELLRPKSALEGEGATVDVVSPEIGTVRGWLHGDWGTVVAIDYPVDDLRVGDYDALLLPGGVMSPDRLRTVPAAVKLVKQFFNEGKPIAVICHGPWLLVEARVARGLKMTSWPSLKTDLVNAGAHWVDLEVVVDRGIVSSRSPSDIPAFNKKMIEEFGERQQSGSVKKQLVGARG